MSGPIRHETSRPTSRLIMWRLDGRPGSWWFGALEDGTVFQKVPGEGWRTVIGSPGDDLDSAYEVLLGATRMAESQGGALRIGPCEFGIDDRIIEDIRADRGWTKNEPMLLIALDMAGKIDERRGS